jgi:hypothetical protein
LRRPRLWKIPEDLRVLRDGSWRVGGLGVVHARTLRHLKAHLVFDGAEAFVVDGAQRVPVLVEGPAFEVSKLLVDADAGTLHVLLDDGSTELVTDTAIGMHPDTGRFECLVRGGDARAVFSRAAHQSLLDLAREEAGRFYLRVGARLIPLRT